MTEKTQNPNCTKKRIRTVIKKSGFLIMLIVALAPALYAQQRTITVKGKITDVNGETMPGVSIRVQGSNIGTISSDNGLYTVNVPNEKSILVFSYLGYSEQIIQVGRKQVIDVVLEEKPSELSEITVLGYTQKKRDVTGSIASIHSEQILERNPVNIYDALQGAAAGVQVFSNSGEPDGSNSVRIRGISTFSDSGANPLYIVDGVQMDDISALNPNDVLSVEILKDAASAAIYGSRSANGVIIITTKQGMEGPPRVEIKYLGGFSQLAHKLPQANRLETTIFERYPNIGLDAHAADSTSYRINSDNDYQDLITRTSMRNQIDLNLSGGTKQLRYRGSVQYLNDQGIILTSYVNRINGRFNMSYQANDKLKISTNINFYTTDKNNINESNVIQSALRRPANLALYYPDGTPFYYNVGNYHPIEQLLLRTNKTIQHRGQIYQAINYKVLPWIEIQGDIAATVLSNDREVFSSRLLDNRNNISYGSASNSLNSFIQGNLWVNFKHQTGEHNLSGMIGSTIEKTNVRSLNISGQDFVSEVVTTLNAASEILPGGTNSNKTANNLVGFYGRFGYDYSKRYLLNLTLRADGSSRLGYNNRWGYFPSASLGWRFSDETFMEWSKTTLTDAKLRFSAGITGQQNIGDYEAQTQYEFGSNYYNGVLGIRPSMKIGNSFLKWEETAQYNTGIDLDFLRSRIVFTGDWYVRDTKDLLYNFALPYEAGYTSGMRTNLGTVRNAGIELTLKYDVIRNSVFKWTTTVNWSQNKNKITSLSEGAYADDIWWIGEGSEAGTFYGWKQKGVYAYDESNAWTPDFKTMLTPIFEKDESGNVIFDKARKPRLLGYTMPDGSAYQGGISKQTSGGLVLGGGDFIWEELPNANGEYDGNVDSEDRQKLGSGHPDWTAGWQNTISYKGITFSFAFYASIGNMVYNEYLRQRCSYMYVNAMLPDPDFIYNTWKYPGQETYVHKRSNFTPNTRRGGDYWLEDGSFIRLQSIGLNYKLPSKWIRKVKINRAEISVYARNLFTWTNYKGFDPEINQSSVLKPGDDTGRYPRKREFGFGINLNF